MLLSMFCQKYYFKIIISVGYIYSSLTRLLSFALVLVSSLGMGSGGHRRSLANVSSFPILAKRKMVPLPCLQSLQR